jgi:hypothetical protein
VKEGEGREKRKRGNGKFHKFQIYCFGKKESSLPLSRPWAG